MDEDEAAINMIWAYTEEMSMVTNGVNGDRTLPATATATRGGKIAKVHSFCVSAECAF